jgi:hypothetical protein
MLGTDPFVTPLRTRDAPLVLKSVDAAYRPP